MIVKFEIVKGHREYTYALQKGRDYWISGSGTFTVEVLQGSTEIFAVILREDFIHLPPFDAETQVRLIGRDTMAFTIFLSDSRTF